jgi:hypothetical protein
LPEIWVPYGPVEVSFDIRQENLSQILEPQPKKLSRDELQQKASELSHSEMILVLSGTNGTQQVLDALLSENKGIKLLFTKQTGALVKRKAQENLISDVVPLNVEDLASVETIDGSTAQFPSQIKDNSGLTVITSVRYDPLFGLTSSASDLISLVPQTKEIAFRKSLNELPCSPSKSTASWFATRLMQAFPNTNVIEIIEKAGLGVLALFSGEIESTHAKVLDFWRNSLKTNYPNKAERIIFGCGGGDNDKSLTDALGRAFFNVIENLSLKDSHAKICMLAECAQGLGSEALFRFVTGRFNLGENLDQLPYFDGLEVLLSFFRVQGELELSMISTLPKYYGEKFQFKMYSGAREAPMSVISPGSRAKVVVVPDASSASFDLGAGNEI